MAIADNYLTIIGENNDVINFTLNPFGVDIYRDVDYLSYSGCFEDGSEEECYVISGELFEILAALLENRTVKRNSNKKMLSKISILNLKMVLRYIN